MGLHNHRLVLLRHGETEWALPGQHTGRSDIPLTAHGRDEARALKPWLAHISFDRVWMSPLRRARDTADLAGFGSIATVEPDLAEWNYGDYEGGRTADIRKDHPDWNIFRDGCPGGETPGQVSDRADRLGPILWRAGLGSAADLQRAGEVVQGGRPLGQVLVDEGYTFVEGESLNFIRTAIS